MEYRAKALHSIGWDFKDAPANTGIHAIHTYPAKFIPQIPRQLIELFHPGDSRLVKAIDKGLDAWGIDLNPLACLIARVKTTSLPSGID